MKFLLLLLLLTSCSYFERDNKPKTSEAPRLKELAEKYELYLSLTPDTQDKNGWILADKCDALIHTALLAAAGGTDYKNLLKARDINGRWFRRPAMDCLSTDSSKSSISRDQLLGLITAAAVKKDNDVIEGLIEYAVSNDWKMGENDGSLDGINRVYLTPIFFDLMLGVSDFVSVGQPLQLGENFSFTDHLDVLSIHLRGYIDDGITKKELRTLRNLAEDDPNNALVHAVKSKYEDGNQKIAVDILLREDLFPKDRLPESKDKCSPYIWMHGEKDSAWLPCAEEKKVHPGHDFLFAAWVILREENAD